MKKNNKNKKYKVNPLFILLALVFLPLYGIEGYSDMIAFQYSFLIGVLGLIGFILIDISLWIISLILL